MSARPVWLVQYRRFSNAGSVSQIQSRRSGRGYQTGRSGLAIDGGGGGILCVVWSVCTCVDCFGGKRRSKFRCKVPVAVISGGSGG